LGRLFYFSEKTKMTRQEVIAAIKRCAEKLGRVPTIFELTVREGLPRPEIRRHFGNYKYALQECQLAVPKWGQPVELEEVFQDWMAVARELKKRPTVYEYERMGKYKRRQLRRFFGQHANVPDAMKLYAEEHGVADQWEDVMELLRQPPRGLHCCSNPVSASDVGAAVAGRPDGPVYGPVICAPGFVYGPTNENGVLCLFGAMAKDLGFLILRVQVGFPDIEAMRVMPDGRLKPVKIEAEYQSRNFHLHGHDPAGCDLLVCWEHNWPECPVPVIELRKIAVVEREPARQKGL
jgi:HNH endonuclease